ncbi:MAG: translocation protein TolB, partial [Acidimicrobiales bacterium]
MHRRGFIRASLVGLGGATSFCVALPAAGAVTEGPYGSLSGRDPDEHGLVLPPGFTARVIAVAGEPVADSGYIWPIFPDGAAVFDDGAGGWIYVANSEVFVPS